METKSLTEIVRSLKHITFNYKYDLIVGIARGGMVPAYLVSNMLDVPLELMWMNFRNDQHQPQRDKPTLLKSLQFNPRDKKILLVDDRANSGQTLAVARSLLKQATVIESLVINGQADYNLFDQVCFTLPWDI